MRKPDQFQAGNVQFLKEQDGTPERSLKARLVDLFKSEMYVSRAYLARVRYGDSLTKVALCVCSAPGGQRALVESIGRIFSSTFSVHEGLDIIFLSDQQEAELMKCCPPFFDIVGGRSL
jgi:hypothetical protein